MGGYKNIPKIEALKLDDRNHLIKMCEYYVNAFCEEYKIDDISKMSEIRFKACLMYIFNNYFRLSKYTDKKRAPYIDSVIDYTDIGQLDAILNSYLYICSVCDKIPSPSGFSSYTNIPMTTLYYWEKKGNDIDIYNSVSDNDNSISDYDKSLDIYNSINDTINNSDSNNSDSSNMTIYDYDYINTIKNVNDYSTYKKYLDIYKSILVKSLYIYNENALADRLASGGVQAVGIIAILNHRHKWDNKTQAPTMAAPQISINDLPKLSDIGADKD